MAKRHIVQLIDDLDGSEATESLTFAIDGVEYNIDLSAANADRLRTALLPFREAGVRVRGTRGELAKQGYVHRSMAARQHVHDVIAAVRAKPRAGRRSPTGRSLQENREIRRWATSLGIEVHAQGAIPSDVVWAYDDAHPSADRTTPVTAEPEPPQPAEPPHADPAEITDPGAGGGMVAGLSGVPKQVRKKATPIKAAVRTVTVLPPARVTARQATTNAVVTKAAKPARKTTRKAS